MSDYLPSEKSPAIERLLETLTGRTSAIEQGVCATCGKRIMGFNNPLSEREYTIGGMCQDCQNSVFGGDNETD